MRQAAQTCLGSSKCILAVDSPNKGALNCSAAKFPVRMLCGEELSRAACAGWHTTAFFKFLTPSMFHGCISISVRSRRTLNNP